jgi:AraC-like DNA-binding protein
MDVLILPSMVAVKGPFNDNIPHHHHALHIVMALQGKFELTVDNKQLEARVAVVAPNASHRLAAAECLLILLEPESHLAADIGKRWLAEGSVADLTPAYPESAFDAIRKSRLTAETLSGFFSRITSVDTVRKDLEPRVAKVIAWIDGIAAAGNWSDISLAGALDIACLSESRFMHLFSEQVGIPWRRYLLWRRLLGAAAHVAAGHSLTEAAHFAAFTDAAHLSKTFKSTFGLSPSAVVKKSRFLQAL